MINDPMEAVTTFLRGLATKPGAAGMTGKAPATSKPTTSKPVTSSKEGEILAEKKGEKKPEKKLEKNGDPRPAADAPAAAPGAGKPKQRADELEARPEGRSKEDGKSKAEAVAAPLPAPADPPLPPSRQVEDVPESMDSTAARILTYSDSEGEDEEPLKVRSIPELPSPRARDADADGNILGRTIVEKVSGVARWAQRGAAPPVAASTGERGAQRLQQLWKEHSAARLQGMRDGLNLGFFLKLLLLLVLRKLRPSVARRLELLCLAIPLPAVLARLQKRERSLPALPPVLSRVSRELQGLAGPALVLDSLQGLAQLRPGRRRRRLHAVNAVALEVEHLAEWPPAQTLLCASELASLYPEAVAEMRRVLAARGWAVPPERTTPEDDGTELMRFAAAEGYMEAGSAERRAAALTSALTRIRATSEWVQATSFMRPRDMRAWGHVVRWHNADPDGNPVLLVRLSRACEACTPNDNPIFRVLTSQLQYAVQHMLADEGGPERLVVVVDGRGISAHSEHRSRYVRQVKALVSALTEHFPERLAAAWVVDLPTSFTSAFRAISMEMSPATRARVHACTAADLRLPIRAKQLDAFAAALPRMLRLGSIRGIHQLMLSQDSGSPSPRTPRMRFHPQTPRTPRVRRTPSRMRSMSEVAEAAAEDARSEGDDAEADQPAVTGCRAPLRRVLGSAAACAGLLAGLLILRPRP